jgi:DNA-binding HxlR family transcriptional regulator
MLQVTALTAEDAENCPVRQVLSKVTGKWQVLLLLALEDGSLRFGELKRLVGDITQRVLTENLRSLERDGYLTRTVNPGPPIAVHYKLTTVGQDLLGPLKALVVWAAESHAQVRKSRAAFDAGLPAGNRID